MQNSFSNLCLQASLAQAVRDGDSVGVEILLLAGAHPTRRDPFGCVPLVEALRVGKNDIARTMLSQECEVDARDRDGDTALSLAVRDDNREGALMLLDRGAREAA